MKNRKVTDEVRSQTEKMRLRAEIEALEPDVTPERLVEFALANPKSLLHKKICSESTSDAVYQRRLELARGLIRTIYVIVEGGENTPPKRHYVHIQQDSGNGFYMVRQRVLSDTDACAQLVEEARGALQAWLRRYDDVDGIEPLIPYVTKAISAGLKGEKV